MIDEWRTATIEEVAEKVGMGPFGSSIKVETFVDEGVPIISGQHLIGTRLFDAEHNYITIEHAERLKNANVYRGDVIFTHAGNIGQVAYIPETSKFDRYVISQRQFYMRCDRSKVIPEFITYFFKTPEGQHRLLANTSSSGVPSIAQPVSYLKTIDVPVPPLTEQRAIAHILGTLDDKIELNRRMNETLEAMARSLFKSWFVDFEPFRDKGMVDSPLGPIPRGWLTKPLDKVADFVNGLALQRYPPKGDEYLPVIKIVELRRGVTESSGKASPNIDKMYIVKDGDILFSWSGSLEVCIWCGGRGALNQHLFKVTSQDYPKWFYYHWIKHHLPEFRAIASGKATTMGHIQRYHLSAALVAIPPEDKLELMDREMMPILERTIHNNLESRTLATTRDTLLPKLLSGQIRIKDAEKSVERAV